MIRALAPSASAYRVSYLDLCTKAILWNKFTELAVLQQYRVLDPNIQLDFNTHHIISAIFDSEYQQELQVFLIPTKEDVPGFLEWLKILGKPDATDLK